MNRIRYGGTYPMLKPLKNRRNTRWTDEEDERLIRLIANDMPWRLIAVDLKRSYRAVERRASKLEMVLIDDVNPVVIFQPNIRVQEPMNLACYAMSDAAIAVVNVLYDKAMIFRAATIAKSYTYQTLKPRLQRVLGAIVRELICECHQSETAGWLKVSTSGVRASKVGINADTFRNLLVALEQEGFLERLNGPVGAMGSIGPDARRGRVTRIRATSELLDFCARHQITSDNAATHFKPVRERHPENATVPERAPS
jgi:hypothetical protein